MKTAGLESLDNQKTKDVAERRSRFHGRIETLSAAVAVFFVIAGSSIPASAGCPSQAQVKEKLERLTHNKVEVVAVHGSAFPGICEVAFRLRSKLQMAYTDADGSHFFFGKIVEADTGRNLTDESLAAINRLSAQEMGALLCHRSPVSLLQNGRG